MATRQSKKAVPGTWNVICQRCQFKVLNTEIKKEWNGLLVCGKCYEPRHIRDFIKPLPDDPTVPFSNPATFAAVTGTDPSGNSVVGISGAPTDPNDADKTLTVGTDNESVVYDTTLTANRVITLATAGLGVKDTGRQWLVSRTAYGAYTLDVGGLYTIPASTLGVVRVEWSGQSWVLISATLL